MTDSLGTHSGAGGGGGGAKGERTPYKVQVKFYAPQKGGGGGNVLPMPKGMHKTFWGSSNMGAGNLSYTEGGGGGGFSTLLIKSGTKCFTFFWGGGGM